MLNLTILIMESSTSNGMCSNNQDPDYQLFNSAECRQNVFETNARSSAAKKISDIIEAEFMKEINDKKGEIRKIFKELSKACKVLDYLRFAIVTDFYNQENALIDPQASKQSRLHPTVNAPTKSVPVLDSDFANKCLQELDQENKRKRKIKIEPTESKKKCLQSVDTKSECESSSEILPVTGAKGKTKRRIIVGNISKWIPPDLRGNNASHKWTVYVRDSEKSDLGNIISKARFFLHPSYKPNDVVELISPPFHLARFGWGEFPIRVQLHFSNGIDKPVDIIHHIQLDRTFTGLQTIGSETVADLWISSKNIVKPIRKEMKKQEIIVNNIKEENLLVIPKEENAISIQKEKPKTIFENKTSYQRSSFYTDHDYIVTNIDPSCRLKNVEKVQNDSVHISNNSIIKTETRSLHNLTKINLEPKAKENPRSLLKINHKKVLINKTVHISTQNELSVKSKSNGNIAIKAENNISHFNNGFNSLNNTSVDDKKIYLKNSNCTTTEENLKGLAALINHSKPESLYSMLKFIARRMPLITEKSTDLHYKMLHPYASESQEVFSNCLSGKQRSLERYRAMYALEVMNNTNWYNYACTVKEFIIWARRYCYTPYLDFKNIYKMCTSSETVKLKDNEGKYKYTATVSEEVKKWLTDCHSLSPTIKHPKCKDEDQIDVVNISTNTSNSSSEKQNSTIKNNSLILMNYPETQNKMSEFICRTTQKIGIKLTNEEIIPGVLHSSASVLINKAVECLIDELTRIAFACSLDKCRTTEDVFSIESDDIRMALLKREEFQIFTNAGLGSDD